MLPLHPCLFPSMQPELAVAFPVFPQPPRILHAGSPCSVTQRWKPRSWPWLSQAAAARSSCGGRALFPWGHGGATASGQRALSAHTMPLVLVCTVMADSPLPCRPWEAAEPAPSSILAAPSASLPRRRWEGGGSAAAGAGLPGSTAVVAARGCPGVALARQPRRDGRAAGNSDQRNADLL